MMVSHPSTSGDSLSTVFFNSSAEAERGAALGRVVSWTDETIASAQWLTRFECGAGSIAARVRELTALVGDRPAGVSLYFDDYQSAERFVNALGVAPREIVDGTFRDLEKGDFGKSFSLTLAEFNAIDPSDELLKTPELRHLSLESALGDIHLAPRSTERPLIVNFTPDEAGKRLALGVLERFSVTESREAANEIEARIKGLTLPAAA
jgi:hypothetical protein